MVLCDLFNWPTSVGGGDNSLYTLLTLVYRLT